MKFSEALSSDFEKLIVFACCLNIANIEAYSTNSLMRFTHPQIFQLCK